MSINEKNCNMTSFDLRVFTEIMYTSLEFYLMLALNEADATHLFPRLWLFLCRAGGGVGRWATTDVSGQVGLRLYFTENDSSDGPGVQTYTGTHQNTSNIPVLRRLDLNTVILIDCVSYCMPSFSIKI